VLQSGWQYYLSMLEEGLSNIIRYRNFENSYTNSKPSLFIIGLGKSETLNPKQIQISQIQNPKQNNSSLKHLPRPFLKERGRNCLDFRILKLGFIPPFVERAGFTRTNVGRILYNRREN